MQTLNRFPTVAEAIAANKATGLSESYWWMKGGNLNRPVIAQIGVGARVREGSYVWVMFGDNCPVTGYKVADLGTAFGTVQLQGPIPPPKF